MSQITPEVERFLRAARADDAAQCQSMLEEKAELVNSVEDGGFSAMHFAAHSGSIRMIETLMAFKPELNKHNNDQNTPLALAAKAKQHDAVSKLVALGADVNFQCGGGQTAAHHAAAMGHTATVKLLGSLGAKFETGATEAGSVLHWACHSGKVDVVGTLIHDYQLAVDAQDSRGATPLFVACHMGKSAVIQFLLECGANPNVPAKDGSTPLHFVAENGSTDDLKTLLAFGADAAAKDGDGQTPADLANKKEHKPAAKELSKMQASAEKRLENAARFKAHGNKVFMEGENVKASKFYTLAITNDPSNHVFFSNRSACHFNMREYLTAMYDAKQCVRLSPKWPKGYFRLAATQNALKQYDQAKATVQKGLALDGGNADLKNLAAELAKK